MEISKCSVVVEVGPATGRLVGIKWWPRRLLFLSYRNLGIFLPSISPISFFANHNPPPNSSYIINIVTTNTTFTMSSIRNAVQRRSHRERGQLKEREKLGLLEKHKV